ncbi:MFS transporter [Streptomyces sp. NPDC005438]|uniref:MFS transporter n=1 Tax=Streptomyces sp. NPDC005438 TaxID=3156880 RepID=UPI0033A4B16A
MPPLLSPYRGLFRHPGTVTFTLGSLVARFPMGMLSLAAILMVQRAYGSYALAGAVAATGLVATAVLGPALARLVDRYGQTRVARPAAVLTFAAATGLVLCVRYEAPLWTLFGCQAATGLAPQVGAMARARWNHLLRADPRARHTANSLEQAADELCFLSGPVLATWLCVSLFPEAGTLVAGVLLLGGTLLFCVPRHTEPVPQFAGRQGFRLPGLGGLLVTFVATGAIFGSMEVVTVAFADEQGQRAWAGPVLACQALGSGLAGLAFGSLRLGGTARARFPLCVTAMAVLMTLPWLASLSDDLTLVAPALLVAGMATAPTMVTAMTLVQDTVPTSRLNEGMTLTGTALLCGVAGGSALGGWSSETQGPGLAYGLPPLAAALAALIAWTTGGRDRRSTVSPPRRLPPRPRWRSRPRPRTSPVPAPSPAPDRPDRSVTPVRRSSDGCDGVPSDRR